MSFTFSFVLVKVYDNQYHNINYNGQSETESYTYCLLPLDLE